MGIFDNAKEVRINNKVVKSIVSSDGEMTLYINGEISQPKSIVLTNLGNSSVVYGTTVQLKATYSELGATLTGKTVTLYDGDTVKTTGTTDSNGEVTFSLPTLSIGTHQFKVTCNNTESEVVSVVVNKITPTLSLTGSNIAYGGTLALSGTLSAGSGKSVKIYNGNTLVDTVTTGSNGAFSKSVTGLGVGSYTFKAVYDGDGTYNTVNSADLAITVSKATPTLNIDVPLNLVYSDAFNITGTLQGVANASVKLKVGNTVVATQTTNSNGQVTFNQTPVSTGTHTFQLVYDGDANYNGCTSSSVTRQINAETTVLNLTSPVNNATYYEGATIPISGTITTNDGETLTPDTPIAVKVYDENNNQLQQFIVSNGAFSGNITAPSSTGNHSITVKFEGASTVPSVPDEEPQLMYAQSEATRSYSVISDSLTLTSNKNILSAHDGEVATLTATLNALDNANKTVTFSSGLYNINNQSVTMTGESISITHISLPNNNDYLKLGTGNEYFNFTNNNGVITATKIRNDEVVYQETAYFNEDGIRILNFEGQSPIVSYHNDNDVRVDNLPANSFGAVSTSGSANILADTVAVKTNSSGVATLGYVSRGAGDVTITVECMNLQETYSIHDYLFVPSLESGTSFYQISGSTSIANGEMSGGSARLTTAWDNTVDWELTFDGKKSNNNCGYWLINPTDTTRDNNCVKLVSGTIPYVYVSGSDTHNYGDLGTLSNNTYYSYTIRKENGVLKIKRSGSSTELTVNWSLLSSLTTIAIGVDTWGHTATIKNIIVKPL